MTQISLLRIYSYTVVRHYTVSFLLQYRQTSTVSAAVSPKLRTSTYADSSKLLGILAPVVTSTLKIRTRYKESYRELFARSPRPSTSVVHQ